MKLGNTFCRFWSEDGRILASFTILCLYRDLVKFLNFNLFIISKDNPMGSPHRTGVWLFLSTIPLGLRCSEHPRTSRSVTVSRAQSYLRKWRKCPLWPLASAPGSRELGVFSRSPWKSLLGQCEPYSNTQRTRSICNEMVRIQRRKVMKHSISATPG